MSDEVSARLELECNVTEEAFVETVCFERVLGDIEGSDAVEDLEDCLCRDAELVDVPHEVSVGLHLLLGYLPFNAHLGSK